MSFVNVFAARFLSVQEKDAQENIWGHMIGGRKVYFLDGISTMQTKQPSNFEHSLF